MNWYEGIFGNEIWKRVIIEVSFWGHAEEHVEKRKGKKYVSRSCYKKKKVFSSYIPLLMKVEIIRFQMLNIPVQV